MSTGVPLASGKGEIFEAVLHFMPEWVQITVLVLVVMVVLASWAVKLRRAIARRRAVREGRAAHTVVPHGQGRGADFLGPYAPQQQARQPSGADFLGSYAPRQPSGDGPA